MKRKVFGMVAALIISATTMAQNSQTNNTEFIQKHTEAVAKKYGLDEAQTKKLLKLNTKYADIVAPRLGARGNRPGNRGMRPGARIGMGPQSATERDSTAKPRMPFTDQNRAKLEEKMNEIKTKRAEYDKELQSIMSEDQYKKYKDDASQRIQRRPRQ